MTNRLTSILAGTFLILSGSVVHAGVMLNSLGGNNWEIQFSPITLTSTGGELNWLVFEDFFASDATAKGTMVDSPSISINVDNGGPQSFFINDNVGTFDIQVGGLDPNDLYINIAQPPVVSAAPGQSVVVTQDGSGVRFNSGGVPALNTSWNGQVAFWDNVTEGEGVQTTETAFVPAPATLAMLGLGLVGLGYSRRKKS